MKQRLFQGTLKSTTAFSSCRFDVITMLDFIEHVYDLRATVRLLHGYVEEGGGLLIATPNYESWMRHLLGDRTVSLKVPEHVTYFTPKTLADILEPAFEVGAVEAIGQYCSWEFLESRIRGVNRIAGSAFAPLARRASRVVPMVPVPSGSMLVFARRRS